MFKAGDKVCFKDYPDHVAIVRNENFDEGVVLLDWPHGAIGSASIENLMLVLDNESPGIDNPNTAFKRVQDTALNLSLEEKNKALDKRQATLDEKIAKLNMSME